MLAECLRQGGAAFDVGFDAEQQVLHRRFLMAATDDLEGLYQRHSGIQHGGQLAAEDGDVAGGDFPAPAAAEQGKLLLHPLGDNALPPQLVLGGGGVGRLQLAFELGAALVGSFPDEGGERKSTRLNSSHVKISYAVFCLNT